MRSRKRSADSLRVGPGRDSSCRNVHRPVAGSVSNDAAHVSCWRVYDATSTSCETLIACSGHPTTHSPNWMHAAWDNERIFPPPSSGEVWIAPVGHNRAQSSHAIHRVKSIAGNPNDGGAVVGRTSVSTPVFRVLARILSIVQAPLTDRFPNRKS